MSPWTRCPAQLPAVSWTLAHWRDHKPQVRALSVRFLSVSIDFSRCSSHWYVILFNHMTYLDIISKYLHNCITKICVYIYIDYLAIVTSIIMPASNYLPFFAAATAMSLPPLCSSALHPQVEPSCSESKIQHHWHHWTAIGKHLSRVTLFLSRAPSGIRVGSDDRANRPNEENEPNPLQQKGSLFHRSSGTQSGHRLRWGTKSQTSELMIKESSNRIDMNRYWKHCQAPNVQARTTQQIKRFRTEIHPFHSILAQFSNILNPQPWRLIHTGLGRWI